MIYLDHNATTPIRPEALDAMMPYLKTEYGNASSIHQIGQRSRKAIEEARAILAKFIGADSPDEVIFTSGGTESNNTILRGVVVLTRDKGRRIVSTAIEHSSIRTPLQHMHDVGQIDNVLVPVMPSGIVRSTDIDDAITPDTVLVSIMAANNEVGTIQPIAEIAEVCKKKKVPLHTDAVQLAGKHEIDVNAMGVDMLSLSGHKFGSPKGTGILYIRKGTRLEGLVLGGRQEKNRRGGTENVAGIVAMGAAAQAALKELGTEAARIKKLRDLFEDLILAKVTHASVNGERGQRTCNTSNICFEYTESAAMLIALDLQGVACSSGSACHAGSADASHVLLAMGLPQEKAHGSLRFSLGHATTEEDVRTAAAIIIDTVSKQRETNPIWKNMGRK